MNTNIIGFKEFRENADKYIDAVANGKVFTIVRRSKPIFNITPIDIWGDEGKWKEVADFTQINKKGINAEDVLESLRRLRKYE